MLFTEKDLRECREAEPGSRDPWDDLGRLVPHLNDHLVEVEGVRFAENGSACLTVFQARDEAKTLLYVLVRSEGDVRLGRVGALASSVTRRLDDFGPLRQGVLSVAVTGRHRFQGGRLDLWIIVRRASDMQVTAYHGLVGLEREELVLEPARDDRAMPEGGRWEAGDASRLPEWLRLWSFVCPRTDDPFESPPQEALAEIRQTEASPTGDIEVVACSRETLGIAVAGEIRLWRSGEREVRRHVIGDWVRALAITDRAPGLSHAVVGPDALHLLAFDWILGVPVEVWRQKVQEFPVALVFLPQDDQMLAPQSWPELLVAFHDGGLQRLLHVGRKSFQEAWNGLWGRLGLSTVERKIEAALAAGGREDRQRRAAILGVVEQALREAENASPKVRQVWLERIGALFRPEERSRVLLDALGLLLDNLRNLVDGKRVSWPVEDGEDFAVALLYKVYLAKSYIAVQDQIDQAFRVLPLIEDQLQDPALKELHRRSTHNRRAVSQEPEPDPGDRETLIRRSVFGIERWANACLQADAVLLGEPPDFAELAGLAGFTHCSGEWLVVGQGHRLWAHRVTAKATLDIGAGGMCELEHDPVRAVAQIPGAETGRLLVACASGKLVLVAIDAATGSLERLDELSIGDLGSPWALACCRTGRAGPVAAVSYNEHRRSTLVLCSLAGDRLREMARIRLDLPRVRSLDLAAEGESRLLLAAGSVHAAPVYVYRLDLKGKIVQEQPFRVLRSGVLAVRFSSPQHPEFLLAGERNGLLWCCNLKEQSKLKELCWTHDLGGAVRAIEPLEQEDGEPVFLVGTEHGRLALLGARDGRRLWKHRLRAPVRLIRQVSGPRGKEVAVALSGGWVVVLERIMDRKQVLEKVKGYLQALDGPKISHAALPEPTRALFRLIRDHESFLAVLREIHVREVRARLIRYLAEEIGSGELGADRVEILRELSLREIQLLISYLPDAVTVWDAMIEAELRRRRPSPPAGDESWGAGMAAWATYLQRLGRRSPDLAAVRDSCPPPEYFEWPWVRLEYVRLLLQKTAAAGATAEDRPGHLLGAVLVSLFDLPFSLTGACADVLRYGSPDATDFVRLRTFIGDLQRRSGPRVEDLQGFTDSLQASGATDGLLRLLAALVELSAVCLREAGGKRDWRQWRHPALAALRRVAEKLLEVKRADPPLGGLVTRLRQCLPPDVPPRDHEPLKHRMSWLQLTRQRLDQERTQEPAPTSDLWPIILYRFTNVVKGAIEAVVGLETSQVLFLVRPHLKLQEVELGEGRHLLLHLVAEPEGSRQLTDVSILFNAGGEDGLLPPGTREDRFDGLSYPEKAASKELLFTGFVKPDQEKVTVRVTLQDEGQYRFEESWSFPVPKGRERVHDRFSFQDNLPRAFECFMDSVLTEKAPVVLVALDGDLGRDAFLERWLARTRGRRVNLDEVVRDIGVGRRYSARPLDLELLVGLDELTSEETQDGAGNFAERPLLVAPVDELLQRLFDGEAKGLMEAWLAWLRQKAAPRRLPQYVIVVSSAHACELRALGLGEIAEVAAHRVLLESAKASRLSPSPLLAELLDLVSKEADLHPEEAQERIEALGWDLRLVLRWLREETGRERRPLASFLTDPRTRKLLELELKSLEPFELINTLVGAETVTVLDLPQVKPGHFAASNYHSTTRRSAPKLLQQEGTPFTERSLSSLCSDLQPPNKVRLQGLGVLGTVEPSNRTGLLSIASHFRREQREVTLRQVAKRGLGSYVHPIFRTGSPYRELVRSLYDGGSRTEANRDTQVYAFFKGRDRSPLESLSIFELSRMSRDELKNLLPDTETRELQRLQRIGRLWDPASTDEADSALTALFQPEAVSKLTPGKDGVSRWDEPFALLSWPVLAVGKSKGENGETYPEDYFLWSAADRPVDLGTVGDAADQVVQLWQKTNAEREDPSSPPRRAPKVTVLGPGTDGLPYDESRRVAVLRSSDLCQAAWEGKMVAGMRRKARSQMRMTALSPFQTSGALRPGSPLFVGREKELSFIKARIRAASILIIGSRRVGKTSLLNQIDGWARAESDLAPIFVDLQGCDSEFDFMDRLRRSLAFSAMAAGPVNDLDSLVEAIRKTGKLPVFLLNEVDALVEKEKAFVSSWRGLNDRQTARFLMVGYSAIGSLGVPDSPFFHFTEGPDLAGKALVLTALSREAAEKLLDLLETTELQIHWVSREDREQAYRLCLDHSYRIPWVLQRYGQLLVEHLEKERRDTLSYQDVVSVVERQGRVVWQYIDGIDYQSLGGGVSNAQRPGFQLVLAAVARRRYFLGGRDAPIRDRLPDRAALGQDLDFTVGEAREIVKETLRQLLVGRERAIVERWFDELDLEQAFRLLTLTLMLEPDPEQDGRYGFLLHILPRELLRIKGKEDPTLDALIVKYAVEFMKFMDQR